MATFTKFQAFIEHVFEGVHNFSSDSTCTITVALTNTAPDAAADAVLADLPTEATYTFCSSRVVSVTSSGQTSGTYKLVLADLTLTASGGTVGPFRYVSIYNDDPTSPADPLIGYYDYGSSITLADTETFLIDFSAANGVIQAT